MNLCEVRPVLWRQRRGYRLANGLIEVTVLLGGGHIADFRLHGSACNLVFESPWGTIDPSNYSPEHSGKYGEGPVGKFLASFTGHALVVGYFGVPNSEEAARGLPLHGEASCADWQVISSAADDKGACLSQYAFLPQYQLEVTRTIHLSAGTSSILIEEQLVNLSKTELEYQWVEHATFGEPFFTKGEAQLYLSAKQGRSWPEGYEGKALLVSDSDFEWPLAQACDGGMVDLSKAFLQRGTGFVVALLTDSKKSDAFAAIHNGRLNIVAGYVFDRDRFPWIALWEENCAREYSPWNGNTRARGIEFGTSPMPTGLKQAQEQKSLFNTPVFATLPGGGEVSTSYQLFATTVPFDWSGIKDLNTEKAVLILRDAQGQTLRIPAT